MLTREVGPTKAPLDGFDSIPGDISPRHAVRSIATATSVFDNNSSETDVNPMPRVVDVDAVSITEDDTDDNLTNGPAAGLYKFFEHRLRNREDSVGGKRCRTLHSTDDVVEPRNKINGVVSVKQEIDSAGGEVLCNGASAVPDKQDIDSTGDEVHVNKKTKTDKTDKTDASAPIEDTAVLSDRAQLDETIEKFKIYRMKSEDFATASENLMKGLQQALDLSKDSIQAKSGLIVMYRDTANMLRVKFSEVLDDKNELIGVQKSLMLSLKEDANSLREDIKEKDKILLDTNDDHEDIMEDVRTSVNELRYVMEFGESSSRGVVICPVTLNPLMPKQTVLMMRADCDCNCMVAYDAASPLIKKFMDGDDLQCMTCNSDITSVYATTTENAEKLFAWRNVENATQCKSMDNVYEDRLAKIEKDKADKTQQDTLDLRNQLDAATVAAAAVAAAAALACSV